MNALGKLNRAWLRVEQFGAVFGLLAMAIVVAGDVLHRKVADVAWQTPGALAGTLFALYGLAVAALRTAMAARPSANHRPRPGWARTLALAGLATAAFVGAARGLVALFPSGLIWSQRLALVLMLWVAFFGASIATHEGKHLRMEAALRLFRPGTRRYAAAFARGAAALACAALALLAGRYCAFLRGEYVATDGVAGVFDELPIPQFAAYAVLPLCLAVMALRFLGQALGDLRGGDARPDGTRGGST